jgi:N-acetylglutamate synthase-like GNAT family acetyltransferase
MTIPDHQVRRATVEDLPQLRELWRRENLPWQDMEKLFKDFQVVQTESGQLIAAQGLRVAGAEGWLFCEAFAQPDWADALRRKLWDRLRIVAQNHGLVRVWTQSSASFWPMNGFSAALPEQLQKKPAGFTGSDQPWWLLPLRDESATSINLDKEFALFQEAQKEDTARLYRQARIAKAIALVIGLVLFATVVALALRFQAASARRSAPLQQR